MLHDVTKTWGWYFLLKRSRGRLGIKKIHVAISFTCLLGLICWGIFFSSAYLGTFYLFHHDFLVHVKFLCLTNSPICLTTMWGHPLFLYGGSVSEWRDNYLVKFAERSRTSWSKARTFVNLRPETFRLWHGCFENRVNPKKTQKLGDVRPMAGDIAMRHVMTELWLICSYCIDGFTHVDRCFSPEFEAGRWTPVLYPESVILTTKLYQLCLNNGHNFDFVSLVEPEMSIIFW